MYNILCVSVEERKQTYKEKLVLNKKHSYTELYGIVHFVPFTIYIK